MTTFGSIRITKQDILEHKFPVENCDDAEYSGKPGKEHYRLLSWLSTQFNNSTIIDIGTHHGLSAAALSYNPSNTIHSFDIVYKGIKIKKPNCNYHQVNLWNPDHRWKWKSTILSSPLIFLDIDPHEGTMEMEFYKWLVEQNYQGILILDDIWMFKGMRNNIWYHISTKKIDLTSVGHFSGTGMVDFGNCVDATEFTYNTDNWTLVTAYFDLTIEPDACDETMKRPASHYIENARATMAVEQNLVVFCNKENMELLEPLRPSHLKEKTKYIIVNFGDFDIVKTCRQIIQNNRVKNPYYFDPRVTASYYLLCMLRYIMVQRVIDENPFKSTHFCWINICIERMGWQNVATLNEALAQNRDKFSTCWIDYQPEQLVNNLSKYFEYGRCGMCSGFFTGRGDYFTKFNTEILNAFHMCLKEGYGHADEQLYSIVYFKNPDIFEPYYGDYTEMITNYVEVRVRATEPVRNLITRAFQHKNYPIVVDACNAILDHNDTLPREYMLKYLNMYMLAAIFTDRWDILQKIRPLLSRFLTNVV
jgi:hypothetical protein